MNRFVDDFSELPESEPNIVLDKSGLYHGMGYINDECLYIECDMDYEIPLAQVELVYNFSNPCYPEQYWRI